MDNQYEVERAKFIGAKEKERELETLRGRLVEHVNQLQDLRVMIFKEEAKTYDDMIDREAKVMTLMREEEAVMEELAEVQVGILSARCAADDALGKAAAMKAR